MLREGGQYEKKPQICGVTVSRIYDDEMKEWASENSCRSILVICGCLRLDDLGRTPVKLQRQIASFGVSSNEMPPLEVSRGSDGLLLINDGVTRACRMAKLAPGKTICVEAIDRLPFPAGRFPAVKDVLP